MLTERELEILILRRDGHSQKTISEQLNISQAAVSQFEKSAKEKLLDAEKTKELLEKEGIIVKKGSLGNRVVWGEKK